ncbi:CLUMA_CG008903, isoform A [Clunio marinus]|uniref:Odorant receptor n=1 Tax=Clunio marinus TaxID=568069 RepID=A0A1J1I4Z4_9DIPT|nr:CLUMA_CG008903, isoform A [Clunio marinus]
MGSATFCYTIFFIETIQSGTIQEISYVTNLLFTFYGSVLKSFWLLKNFQKIKEMLNDLKIITKVHKFNEGEKKCLKHLRIDRVVKVVKIYFSAAFVTGLMGTLNALIKYNEKEIMFETWWFFDYKASIIHYWTIFIYQHLFLAYIVVIACSTESILILFMNTTTALIDDLIVEIKLWKHNPIKKILRQKVFFKNSQDYHALKKLEIAMEYHLKIKKIVEDISKHISFVFFVQTFISSIVICGSVFLMTVLSQKHETSDFFRTAVFGCLMTFQIFLPCYYGNELSVASDKILSTLFHSDWVSSSQKYKNSLKIFLENTKRTIKVRSFKIVNIDFETYTTIMNAAYSLYALMNKINQK